MMFTDWIDAISGGRPLSRGALAVAAGVVVLAGASVLWLGPVAAWCLLVAFALLFGAIGVLSLRRIRRASGWARVPAEILEVRVGEARAFSRSLRMRAYFPDVHFRYETPEGTRESARFAPLRCDPRSLLRRDIEPLVAQFAVGDRVDAWVDPQDDRCAALHRETSAARKSQGWALVCASILLLVVALGLSTL